MIGPMFIGAPKGLGTVPTDFDIGDWVTNKDEPLAAILGACHMICAGFRTRSAIRSKLA